MRVDALGGHLTYCTNIHPGESWTEVRANVAEHVTAVKAAVTPNAPLGVGLRLSAAAAQELQGETLVRFKADLERWGLYVFTINGFPYGRFHGSGVKENVYRPDWLEPERIEYTRRLIEILAALLPDGVEGSISTVPGCFAARAAAGTGAKVAAAALELVGDLDRLQRERGVCIALALEPEPCCFLETIAQTVEFFDEQVPRDDTTRRHLGVCLDTCHAAVEFEDPDTILDVLASARVRVAKIQVTTGLRLRSVDSATIGALGRFADDVYLHQVVARKGDDLMRVVDLEPAFERFRERRIHDEEWRVHFHVPVFLEELAAMHNTQEFLRRFLAQARAKQPTAHYELETYTWDVLPAEFRTASVDDAICRELQWVIDEVTR